MFKIVVVIFLMREKLLWRRGSRFIFWGVSFLKLFYYRKNGEEISIDIISLLMRFVNIR